MVNIFLSNLGIRLDNFGAKTLKSKRHKMRMVAEAVTYEPVSIPKFPANREKNREFFNFRSDRGSGGPIHAMILRP